MLSKFTATGIIIFMFLQSSAFAAFGLNIFNMSGSRQLFDISPPSGTPGGLQVPLEQGEHSSLTFDWLSPQCTVKVVGDNRVVTLGEVSIYVEQQNKAIIATYKGGADVEPALTYKGWYTPAFQLDSASQKNWQAVPFSQVRVPTSVNSNSQLPLPPLRSQAAKQLAGRGYLIRNNAGFLNIAHLSKVTPGKVGLFQATPPKHKQWMEPQFNYSSGANSGTGWYLESVGQGSYRIYTTFNNVRQYISVSTVAASQLNSSPGTSSLAVMVPIEMLTTDAERASTVKLDQGETKGQSLTIDGVGYSVSGEMSNMLNESQWKLVD